MGIKILIIVLVICIFLITFGVYVCLVVASKADEKMEELKKLRKEKFKEVEDDLPY